MREIFLYFYFLSSYLALFQCYSMAVNLHFCRQKYLVIQQSTALNAVKVNYCECFGHTISIFTSFLTFRQSFPAQSKIKHRKTFIVFFYFTLTHIFTIDLKAKNGNLLNHYTRTPIHIHDMRMYKYTKVMEFRC